MKKLSLAPISLEDHGADRLRPVKALVALRPYKSNSAGAGIAWALQVSCLKEVRGCFRF